MDKPWWASATAWNAFFAFAFPVRVGLLGVTAVYLLDVLFGRVWADAEGVVMVRPIAHRLADRL